MQDAKLHHQAPPRLTPGTTAMVETLQALGAQGSGCLYRLVDPDGSADRALSESAGKGYGRIKHPFVAQVPEKRLYLQPMGGASLVLGDGLAEEVAADVAQEIARIPASRLDPVPFCGWVYSRAPLAHLVNHLYQQRVIRNSKSVKPALFRYQDPRVFERLLDILSSDQLNHLLGPIEAWWYLDHQRQLQGVQMSPFPAPLSRTSLAPHQWQAVKRIGRVNACLEHCHHLERDDLRQVSPVQIDELLVKAEQHDLIDETDQIVFVVQFLLIPGLDRHPSIQRLLPRGGETMPFTQAIKRLKAGDWHRIQHDLEHRIR